MLSIYADKCAPRYPTNASLSPPESIPPYLGYHRIHRQPKTRISSWLSLTLGSKMLPFSVTSPPAPPRNDRGYVRIIRPTPTVRVQECERATIEGEKKEIRSCGQKRVGKSPCKSRFRMRPLLKLSFISPLRFASPSLSSALKANQQKKKRKSDSKFPTITPTTQVATSSST